MSEGWNVLVQGGVALPASPGTAAVFLRGAPHGAYTTTRTAGGASSVLLWERHLARLSESLQLLAAACPHLYPSLRWDLDVRRLVQPSVKVGLTRSLEMKLPQQEISFTVLVCGNEGIETEAAESGCEVYVHASNYKAVAEGKMLPPTSVAVMGPGRTLARVKYSIWASTRERLEKLRPLNTSEIILSNNGDSLLEGTLTNFFVVASTDQNGVKHRNHASSSLGQHHWRGVEVQTAPLEDGVLPGIIRDLVIEVCREAGIPLREVAPSWASRQTWKEAFVTSGIRILQPVNKIQMPSLWVSEFYLEKLQGQSWQHLELQVCGLITQEIHKLVMQRAMKESISIEDLVQG